MTEGELEQKLQRVADFYRRRWPWLLLVMWAVYCAWALFDRSANIAAFALSDTDDNLRMAQVRALLGGQDWFDLRQHRFDAIHGGANIHWSRIVDLPIAGLYLLAKPFVGGAAAERFATAFAPLIPLGVLMASLALTMRRLVDSRAWALPVIGVLCAYSTVGMFVPLRIDHHGWQLAMLGWAVAGMADPKRARGGAVTGIATGISLAIGLEMMIYLALLGGSTVLLWVADREQRRRLAAYAAALVATTGLGFLLFASYDNRQAVCDALSPVWLSDAAVGGAVMLALAWAKVDSWKARLGLAIAAGAVVAGFHAMAWPQCLSRLEGVSDEANRLWLSHVREARPFWKHGWRTATVAMTLPATGLVGWGLLLVWQWRKDEDKGDRFRRTLAIALPAVAAGTLLFWQMRSAPAAQMLALPAATAIVFIVGGWMMKSERFLVRISAAIVILLGFGALVPLGVSLFPERKIAYAKTVDKANASCPSFKALAPVGRQPKGMVFTFIDLGPRLIVGTHHDTVGGPYHRNYRAIVDVMHAFRGDEAQARRIITEKYASDYVLVCPDMATATIFRAEAPKGFYVQLVNGKVPAWLRPIDLGKDSPLKMWRVVR